MKYWFGYPVLTCECGFETPDEDEFDRHLALKRHKPKKEEPAKKPAVQKTKETKTDAGQQPKEENNGL